MSEGGFTPKRVNFQDIVPEARETDSVPTPPTVRVCSAMFLFDLFVSEVEDCLSDLFYCEMLRIY